MLNLDKLPGATPDEKIELVLRRHWLVMLSLVATLIVVVALPIGALIAIKFIKPDFFADSMRTVFFVMGASVFFLYAWLFVFQSFIDYYLDTWIVTNRRILNIEQHGIFARTVSELSLHRVQDVTSEIRGMLHNILDYGFVHIQTAGEQQRFEFEEISNPNEVAKKIMELVEKFRRKNIEELKTPAK